MKIKLLLLLNVFLLTAAACVSVYSQTEAEQITQIAGFFEGTWKTDGKENYESWKQGCGLFLEGKGFTVEDGSEKISENLVIRIIEGKVYLLATVPGQNNGATVRFQRTNFGGDAFVFENPEHDFPKKIVYKKISPTEIGVRVEGEAGKGFSYTIRKLEKAN